MGQRHQIYAFVKDENGKTVGAGIHHQWLFGYIGGMKAAQVMVYAKKALKDEYHPFRVNRYALTHLTQCLKALYQVNMETGHFNTSVSYLDQDGPGATYELQCLADPEFGDNNDGITVFDFTDPKSPAYCFVNIHQDYDPTSHDVHALVTWTPNTLGDYVRAYEKDKKVLAGKEYTKLFRLSNKFKCMGQADLERLFSAKFNSTPRLKRIRAGV